MKKFTALCALSALFTGSSLSNLAFADETFVQDGSTYVVKSDLKGIIRSPGKAEKPTGSIKKDMQKQNSFFDVYDTQSLSQHGAKLVKKKKYQVVYKQVKNSYTNEIKEVPALLSGQLIVKTKNIDSIKTSLKLKKSYHDNGFYVYQIADNQSIAQALQEIQSQPGVEKANVEVIEHLNVPM